MLRFNIVQSKRNDNGRFGKNASVVLRIIIHFAGVEFSAEHLLALEHSQTGRDTDGPTIEPVDTALTGKYSDVKIERSTRTPCK